MAVPCLGLGVVKTLPASVRALPYGFLALPTFGQTGHLGHGVGIFGTGLWHYTCALLQLAACSYCVTAATFLLL